MPSVRRSEVTLPPELDSRDHAYAPCRKPVIIVNFSISRYVNINIATFWKVTLKVSSLNIYALYCIFHIHSLFFCRRLYQFSSRLCFMTYPLTLFLSSHLSQIKPFVLVYTILWCCFNTFHVKRVLKENNLKGVLCQQYLITCWFDKTQKW